MKYVLKVSTDMSVLDDLNNVPTEENHIQEWGADGVGTNGLSTRTHIPPWDY